MEVKEASALIEMYAKYGSMLEAQKVLAIRQARSRIEQTSLILEYAQNGETVQKSFSTIMVSNIVSWNALKRGYKDHGHAKEALYQFEQMQDNICILFTLILIPMEDIFYGKKNLPKKIILHVLQFLIIKWENDFS